MVNIKNLLVSPATKKAYIEKAEQIIASPIKTIGSKPDVFSMSPSVKASVKQQIKKFDDANIFQKGLRFISKTKVGKALVFGAMAIAAAVLGKATADKTTEEK